MSFPRHTRTSYLVLAAAVAIALSACASTTTDKAKPSGSSSAASAATTAPSAATVYQQMRTSGAAAKSVHIKGAFTDKGQKLQIDIAGDRAGKNMKALVDDGNGQVEILAAAGDVYIKGDAAYWTKNGSAAIAKVAAGKYVKVPAGSAASLDDLKVGTLLDQIVASDMSTADKLNTNVQTTSVDGVRAYLLTTKVGGDAKIFVSADGKARLLRVEGPKTQPGTLVFTQWDAVAPVSAPSADQLATIPGM